MALANRKKFTSTLSLENTDKLDQLQKHTRINKSVLLDEAVEYLYNKYIENKKS